MSTRETVKCYADSWRVLGFLLPSGTMMGVAALFAMAPNLYVQMGSWVGLVLSGLLVVHLCRRLFQQEPLVVIDERKIEDRRAGWQVPWQDVESVWVYSDGSTRYLCVEVEDASTCVMPSAGATAILQRKMAALKSLIGFPEIVLSFQELEPGLPEAWAFIKRLHPDRAQE